jgi:hypothetical protein
MSKLPNTKLVVQCLLEEYSQCAECFRHTYATIWQSGLLFATFSAAVFGFFFSFQDRLHLSLPYLPFVSLSSIIIWWLMVFEPMNRYGDSRTKRCRQIEEELSIEVTGLKMKHFGNYDTSKGRYMRVRNGVRLLAFIIIVVMVLLGLYFALGWHPNQTVYV